MFFLLSFFILSMPLLFYLFLNKTTFFHGEKNNPERYRFFVWSSRNLNFLYFLGPGKLLWASIFCWLVQLVGDVVAFASASSGEWYWWTALEELLNILFMTFYFINIGILIGSLVNTFGAECRQR